MFIKRFDAQEGANYPDVRCNVESFYNDMFIELEPLGELTLIAPGQTITHDEIWQVTVLEVDGQRLRVAPLEAIHGTPVIDIKPVLKQKN